MERRTKRAKHSEEPEVVVLSSDDEFVPYSKSSRPSSSKDLQDQWTDRFCPSQVDDLAVHKKRVTEVLNFLQRNTDGRSRATPRVLVLCGPAGCGKSTMVRVVAASLGLEVSEYITPAGVHWQAQNPGDGTHNSSVVAYESRLQHFREFMLRSCRYQLPLVGLVSSATDHSEQNAKQRVVVVEEFPLRVDKNAQEHFHDTIRTVVRSASHPVIFIISTESSQFTGGDSSSHQQRHSSRSGSSDGVGADRVLPKDVLESHQVVLMNCNPVAPTFMLKALQKVASLANAPVPQEVLQGICDASAGDLRSAVHSLQLDCTGRGIITSANPASGLGKSLSSRHSKVKPSVGKARTSKNSKLKGKTVLSLGHKGDQAVSHTIGGKDVFYSLFHMLGKIMYGKREGQEGKDGDGMGSVDASSPRGQLTFIPESVAESVQIPANIFHTYLHHNLPHFFTEIDDCVKALDYLSTADLLVSAMPSGSLLSPSERQTLAPYVVSVASRGVLWTNMHPAPRRWLPFTAPEVFRVTKAAKDNFQALQSLFQISSAYGIPARPDRFSSLESQGSTHLVSSRVSRTEIIPFCGQFLSRTSAGFSTAQADVLGHLLLSRRVQPAKGILEVPMFSEEVESVEEQDKGEDGFNLSSTQIAPTDSGDSEAVLFKSGADLTDEITEFD